MKPTLAIIDDETLIRQVLRHHFERRGYRVLEASTASQGIQIVREEDPDVVLLDLKLPDLDGLSTLNRIKTSQPDTAVIVLTAHGTYEKAVEAVKGGAEDFLIKEPAEGNLAAMELRVSKAVDRLRKDRIRSYYSQHFRRRATDKEPAIPGEHPSIVALNGLVDLVAQNPSTTLLITGESGTGKELAAKAIHQKSSRRDKAFVEINCAGLSENLLDSELFGHERGSFTDAKSMKRGLLEVADSGTVLLDEIGDMSLAVQPKLLRVLETRSFRRVGGLRDISVDVRIITATNKDLKKLVETGSFREDLYYRLKVIHVKTPPLREIRVDIPLLANHFLSLYCKEMGKGEKEFSPGAMESLSNYQWPGNVRELENEMKRLVVSIRKKVLDREHLSDNIRKSVRIDRKASHSLKDVVSETVEELEKEMILDALEACQNNQLRAAARLGLSRQGLFKKIKRYGLR